MKDVTERLDIVEHRVRMLEAGERGVGAIADVEVVQRSIAGDANYRSGRGLYEVHLQKGRERAGGQLDRQFRRDVAHVEGEVEVIDADADRGFGLREERQRPSADQEGTAIDDHVEERLDEDISVGRQVRNKRDAEFEVLDGMRLIQDLVVETDVAVLDADIGKREALGF